MIYGSLGGAQRRGTTGMPRETVPIEAAPMWMGRQGLGKVRACLVGDDGVSEPGEVEQARPPAIMRAPRAGPPWRSTLRSQRRSWTPSSHVSCLDTFVWDWD